MDLAHTLASGGAPAGTLVLANEQTAGRGRGGRAWVSAPGDGLWLTLIERPRSEGAVAVLSLRLGLRIARALERWTRDPVRLKWPNDLYTARGKLGGILVETRWRDACVDWAAIGVGINIRSPVGVEQAAGLDASARDRVEILAEIIPMMRAAATAGGPLTAEEIDAWESRDIARGRRCVAPAEGIVRGLAPDGALIIDTLSGEAVCRTGSLILKESA